MKSNQIITTAVLVIIFVGIGFFAGTKYQQKKSFSRGSNINGFKNISNGNRPDGMGGNVSGEVSSVDEKTLTIKMTNGSSKIVLLTEKTSINKASEASISDLIVGEKIAVFGSTNTDGSVTAQNIQLNPLQKIPDIGQGSQDQPQDQPQDQIQPKN